ncbi:GNAT family N-acetyltransferase [Agromyces endophyticus]|uniref:GNAT family N-acetyltransferase n=1 Tax=Agromyces sp. H17E-10 TaxID=2932244 RepID=UPI001FD09FD7|nr:GNAT family N-acetyltransferase [Agromyces sp. H17E-10]UOQ90254.1 GNAT family N-acetyltransferase [Agromyces sp. H17E-10]
MPPTAPARIALPVDLEIRDDRYTLRRTTLDDLPALVALLAADALRRNDDSTDPEHFARYERAFDAIDADPAQTLVSIADADGRLVGTMQLTLIPGLARGGAYRMQIEAVRVADDLRGRGVGSAMIRWAVDQARASGAALVQLTSDARREDAHRFYERLGFAASHVGFKLFL